MTILNFLWIDDDENRVNFKKSLEAYKYKKGAILLKAKVDFMPVKGIDFINEGEKNSRSYNKFDLIIIDHMLVHAKGPGRRGTTVAEVIREKAPKCPIVGVTAAMNINSIDQHVLSIYESLFFIDKLSDSFSSIFTIAATFKELNSKVVKSLDSKVKLFLPPNDDVDILKQILPTSLPNLDFIKSNIRSLAHWTLYELIPKPGLLYDKYWAANLAGIKKNSFYKIERLFSEAKYEGIFCDAEKPRWWKSKLKQIIFSKTKNKNVSLPWEAGHDLPGISKSDYSVCHFCDKLFPETLGYTDTSESRSLVPLHYCHSKTHPELNSQLFFDEIRLMKDIKK